MLTASLGCLCSMFANFVGKRVILELEKMSAFKEQGQERRNKRKKDWDNFGEYMQAKVRKLEQQFTVEAQSDAIERKESSTIFKGLSIFVDGYTIPPADELRKLFVLHGGRFRQYYSLSSVTHIIATNLPDSKITEIRDKKIVRPQWILDSIKEQRCLPIDEYLLYTGRQALQKQLNFSKGGYSTCTENLEIQNTKDTKEPRDILPQSPGDGKRYDSKAPVETSTSFPDALKTNVCGQTEKDTETPPIGKEGNTRQLKAGEPNFINEFYSNSRLHHLSTWGAEFKQFTSDLIKKRIENGVVPPGHSGPGHSGRIIMHIDMDCFFVSVGLRNRPTLYGKPVAVCHAGKEATSPGKQMMSSLFFTSMSEIASCSYEARKAGVRNGMFLGSARKLCPDIVCIPYNFQDYRDVSKKLFEILVEYSHDIEAVSCDEAYLDVTHSINDQTTPLALAQKIRQQIREKTGCNASIGIGSNVLLARMCTRLAKPNGAFYLSADDDVLEFMGPQKVTDLPGVGRAQGKKLNSLGITSCADLHKCNLQFLQQSFGEKTGLTLYRFCRGQDDRPIRLERERKSVSAEINYGMRFTKELEAEQFINELSGEVQRRLKECGLKGQSITLKLKVRRQGVQEPLKFMGHGICDNIARSAGLQVPTDDSKLIFKKCLSLFRQLRVPPSDVRGLGIQVNKLKHPDTVRGTLHDFARSSNYRECQPSEKAVNKATTDLKYEEYDVLSSVINSSSASPPNSFCYVKERNKISWDTGRTETSIKCQEKLDFESDMLPPLPRFSPLPLSSQEIQSTETSDDELCLPSLSQLDVSALDALPEDIRSKIERHYKKKEIRKEEEYIMITEESPSPQKIESTAVSLGGEVSFHGVKDLIKKWTNTSAPIQVDVKVVTQYFLDLIQSKNMEQLYLLVKVLMRCIKRTENKAWKTACHEIVDRVQLSVIDQYGAPLVF